MKKCFTFGLIAAAFWSGQAVAQTPMPITNDDFSKETENPVTRQITLPSAIRRISLTARTSSQRTHSNSIRLYCRSV